ncbi:MAG: DUF3379 family protein [Acidiferrobacterales bacterium]
MNCLEFRRHCLADPASQDGELLRHRRDCPRCAEFAASIAQLDKKFVEALRIDVPDNLVSRIILRQSIYLDESRQRHRRRMYALAASLFVAIGLTIGVLVVNRTPPLDRQVIAHVELERALLLTRQEVSRPMLVQVLDTVGAELKGSLGPVRHVSLCHLSKHGGAHIVFDGKKGPVIALLLPKQFITGPTMFRSDKFGGMILPTNNGSMALVGAHGEQLQEVAHRMRTAITWRL